MSKRRALKFLDLWLPVILWAAIIFKLSSGTVPQVSTFFLPNFMFMKSAHVLFFGALSLLFYRALLGTGLSRKQSAIYAVILTFFYGGTDEFHQMFTQGREARVRDVFIDGAGAFVFTYFFYWLLPKFPKKIQNFLLELGIK
jgi:VanZ family protein